MKVKRPSTESVLYELTEQRKEYLVKLSDEVLDILTKRCSNLEEAAIVLHFLQKSLEETMGSKIEAFMLADEGKPDS